MSHNNLSNNALGMLADALAVNVKIEEISMTHNDLSLPNGVKVIRALKNMTGLKKLSLNSCTLDQELLQELVNSLAANESLTDLNLYSNEINSEGAQMIA
jgi:Ran GTPase-activating protein (RanGAP) involved in mRNA processing and transport